LPGMDKFQEEESLNELAALADTAGAVVVGKITQNRKALDRATVIGSGKLEELTSMGKENQATTVIFDLDLTPGQMKNLENELEMKIIDRSSLILDIFAGRARSHESQLQVELAQMEYFLPRLTRQWTHLSRQEGGIGTRGPGETQLETDRRAVWKRISYLKNKLTKVEKQRETRRKTREGFQKIALVGYTNVGKSTMMNLLTGSDTFVENRLFATLDATIRSMLLEEHREVLLIDTVGFIRKLPTHLVASFRSTLEETADADLLLHVVDVSHPQFEAQIQTVMDVLTDLKIEDRPIITVFNKVDRLENRELLPSLKNRFPNAVFTSARNGIGTNQLKEMLISLLETGEKEGSFRLPAAESKIISYIHKAAKVTSLVYEENDALIKFRASVEQYEKIVNMMKGLENADIDY